MMSLSITGRPEGPAQPLLRWVRSVFGIAPTIVRESWPCTIAEMDELGFSDWAEQRRVRLPDHLPAELRAAYWQGYMDGFAHW